MHADNIGIVSDQFSQVHAALDESKQDFERKRLLLHENSLKSDSGRRNGFLSSTSNSFGLSLPWNVLIAFAKGSDTF